MNTILLDVRENRARAVDIDDDLSAFYEALHCRNIDIAVRTIGGRQFDIMCDDEGLYNQPVEVSAISIMGDPMLVGSLMFFHHTDEGELTGLSLEDMIFIRKHIRNYTNILDGSRRVILTGVDYV